MGGYYMIRTLIIDDEYWVCQLICDLIDWNNYGFEIIGQAYNGDEALEKISDLKPDLVFTDIRMPGRSGLELIEHCKTHFPDIKFVIISGHNEFEYAQAALTNGALGYLLKPVEPEELIALISQIKNNLFSHFQKKMEDQQLKQQLLENKRKLKEQYFASLLKEDLTQIDTLPIALINEECSSDFADGMFLVFQFTIDTPDASCYFDSVLTYMSQKIYAEAASLCYDLVVLKQYTSIVCLTNFSPENASEVKKGFRDLFYSFKQYIPNLSNYKITLGVGCISEHYISQSFALAQEAIHSRIKLGTNRIIDLSASNYRDISIDELFLPSERQMLKDTITKHTAMSAQDTVRQIFDKCFREDWINPSVIMQLLSSVLTYIYSVPIAANLDISSVMSLEMAQRTSETFSSLDQIVDFTASLLEELQTLCAPQDTSTSAAKKIRNYIDLHYNQDISLNDLSAMVYLNTKYISDLFKKEYNITITDYIAQKRIEEAKQLLLRSALPITEISDQVGYHDAKYFAKLFKRYNGISPAQFRKLYQ